MTVSTVCEWCAKGDHEECIDNVPMHDGEDARGFVPLCPCDQGECAETISYACLEALHNCPGCPCSCHDDPGVRAAWDRAHQAWVEQMLGGNRGYGPRLAVHADGDGHAD